MIFLYFWLKDYFLVNLDQESFELSHTVILGLHLIQFFNIVLVGHQRFILQKDDRFMDLKIEFLACLEIEGI